MFAKVRITINATNAAMKICCVAMEAISSNAAIPSATTCATMKPGRPNTRISSTVVIRPPSSVLMGSRLTAVQNRLAMAMPLAK